MIFHTFADLTLCTYLGTDALFERADYLIKVLSANLKCLVRPLKVLGANNEIARCEHLYFPLNYQAGWVSLRNSYCKGVSFRLLTCFHPLTAKSAPPRCAQDDHIFEHYEHKIVDFNHNSVHIEHKHVNKQAHVEHSLRAKPSWKT